MKHYAQRFLALCLLFVCIISTVQAQTPQAINYQAALRNADGSVMASTAVNLKFTIIHDNGTPEDYYIETHTITTTAQGIINVKLGSGTAGVGTIYAVFANIPWSEGNMLLKVEVQIGAAAYTDMGTQQLVSVPFALHAANTEAIANKKVSSITPSTNEVLKYNGTEWAPGLDNNDNTGGWGISGNSVTSSNFIGTTNPQDLRFRRNNQPAGFIADNYGTSIGVRSLSNTTGAYNSAFGTNSLRKNTSGSSNSAFGFGSLDSNLVGSDNCAFGFHSLRLNKNENNSAFGASSLRTNSTGNANSAFGTNSGYNNTTGAHNTAVGVSALYYNVSGNYNTAVGYLAGYGLAYSNATSIGYGAPTVNSNRIRLGNASTIGVGAQIGWTSYSDARIKTNVQDNVPGLVFITKLRPVTYKFDIHTQNKIMGMKDESDYPEKYDIENITQTGFIAQEVENAAKEIGYNFSGISLPSNDKDLYGLRYSEFVVPLVKAVQEQQIMIEVLQAANLELQKRMYKIENK